MPFPSSSPTLLFFSCGSILAIKENSEPSFSSSVRRKRERLQTLARMISPSIPRPILSEMMFASVISNLPFLNKPAMLTSEKSSAGSSMPEAFAPEILSPSTDKVNRPSSFCGVSLEEKTFYMCGEFALKFGFKLSE